MPISTITRLCLIVFGVVGCAAVSTPPPATGDRTAPESSASLIEIYRGPLNHLQAIRAGSCPMHPSCSEYGRQALATHGAVIGWLLTQDRLLRCGRLQPGEAPRVFIDGHLKYLDPLDVNTFWAAPPVLQVLPTSP